MQIVAGKFKGRLLKAPKGQNTRPTSAKLRAAFFNKIQNQIDDVRFLDLFSGSGAIGLEALSRGASHASFVDSNSFAVQSLKENIKTLKTEKETSIYPLDIFKALKKMTTPFDIIYADPPYQLNQKNSKLLYISELLKFFDQSPLLKDGGSLFIEEGGKYEVKEELKHLSLVDERHYGSSYLYEFVKSPSSGIV